MTLKGYPLQKLTLKDQKMIKQLSAENILQRTRNIYVSKPIDTTIRDEPDPAPLCNPPPPDSRRQSQISLGRSQSSFTVNTNDDPVSTLPWNFTPPDSRRQSRMSIGQAQSPLTVVRTAINKKCMGLYSACMWYICIYTLIEAISYASASSIYHEYTPQITSPLRWQWGTSNS